MRGHSVASTAFTDGTAPRFISASDRHHILHAARSARGPSSGKKSPLLAETVGRWHEAAVRAAAGCGDTTQPTAMPSPSVAATAKQHQEPSLASLRHVPEADGAVAKAGPTAADVQTPRVMARMAFKEFKQSLEEVPAPSEAPKIFRRKKR